MTVVRPELQFGVARDRRRRAHHGLSREAALGALGQRRVPVPGAGGAAPGRAAGRARARAARGPGRRRARCARTGTRASGTAWTPTRTPSCSTTSTSAGRRRGAAGEPAVRDRRSPGAGALVTGAYGMLGAWLCRALLDRGAAVVVLRRDERPGSALTLDGTEARCTVVRGDLLDADLLERTVGEHEIDTVLHLAAQTIVGTANRSPRSTFESNVRGTWNVLEACRAARRSRARSSPRPTRPTARATSCRTPRTCRCAPRTPTTPRRPPRT